MKLLRLRPQAQPSTPLKVEREVGHGVIRGVSLATTGPALGHGFELDETTIDQVAEHFEGRPGRWTHGELSGDGLGQHLGHWRGLSTREVKIQDEETGEVNLHRQAVGDFHFSASAWKLKPDGLDAPAPEYLMDRAEEDPSTFGTSIVSDFAMLEERDSDGEVVRRLGRIRSRKDAKRADFVADPAANPVGLHAGTGTMSEVLEVAAPELHKLARRVGAEEARDRIDAYVTRELELAPRTLSSSTVVLAPIHPQAALAAEDAMELKEALEALKKKDAELGVLRESLDTAKATIQAMKAAEAKREEEAQEAYLSSLNDRAIEGGAKPFTAAELASVRKALGVDSELAKELAESKLALKLAGTTPTESVELDNTPKDDHADYVDAIVNRRSLSDLQEAR